jgi:hypothetical protein
MTGLDAAALGAIALLAVGFYLLRRVPSFLTAGAVVVGLFAFVTRSPIDSMDRSAAVVGLAAWVVGLVIVRVMLIRSVSLHLLSRVDRVEAGSFDGEIAGRLHDLRAAHLARTTAGRNTLTPVGQLVGAVGAIVYRAFGIAR